VEKPRPIFQFLRLISDEVENLAAYRGNTDVEIFHLFEMFGKEDKNEICPLSSTMGGEMIPGNGGRS
jgi:hypothetical protein